MHSFHEALGYINRTIFAPNHLIVTRVKEERQNSDYAAGRFKLSTGLDTKTVRFRVAKQTSTKIGQFVTFWEKDANKTNQPYPFDEAPDLLVITVFRNNGMFGQFVFPKAILIKKGILRTNSTKGKMAIRVYPSWDSPTSTVAIQTQHWQLDYFFEVSNIDILPTQKIVELYAQSNHQL